MLAGLFILALLLVGCGAPANIGKLTPAPHWQPVRLSNPGPDKHPEDFSDIVAPDAGHLWLARASEPLLMSGDGGTSWQPAAVSAFFLDFPTPQVGWATSPQNAYYTKDAGKSWQDITRGKVFAVAAVSDKEAWALPVEVKRHGTVLHTTDGGASWQEVLVPGLPATVDFFSVNFPNPRQGFFTAVNATGYDKDGRKPKSVQLALWLTQDGGRTFQPASLPTARPSGMSPCRPTPAGPREIWLAFGNPALLHSTDSGKSWRLEQLNVAGKPNVTALDDCTFLSAQEGWAVGDGGTALHTTDGGKSWQRVPTGAESVAQAHLMRVVFADPRHGWIIGRGGKINLTQPTGMFGSKEHGMTFVLRYVP